MSEDYRKYILIATPGAPEGQGGIIRQMRYLQQAWPQDSDWKLEWMSTWHHGGCKPCRFVRSLLKMMWRRYLGRADILHLNLASQGSFYRKYLLARVARMMRLPFVVHLHGGGFQTFYDTAPAMLQRRIEWLFYYAQHCVVLGADWQHFLELRFRMPHEKITICPNAVPDAPQSTPQNDAPHLLFVGHVLPRKGVDDLLAALSQLTDLNWHITIAGSGKLPRYRDEVARLGLQSRVKLTGWLDEQAVNAQYAKADMVVLPSYVENQPLTIIEAMARGVAVIASKVGTIPEMIEHGKTGLLIDAGNVDALAAAMKILIEDKAARQKLAAAARSDYEARFTLARYTKTWAAIYQETLSF